MHAINASRQRISRRLCNAPFVLWMLALNTSLLLLCLLVETLEEKRFTDPCKIDAAAAAPAAAAAAVPADSAFERLGALLWAIDRSQLLFFVLANLCTGIVNVAVNTMLVADRTAFAIVTSISVQRKKKRRRAEQKCALRASSLAPVRAV